MVCLLGWEFAAETPPRMSGDAGGWFVGIFHGKSCQDVHADQWEMHPCGDEAVCVLAGTVRPIPRGESGAGEEEPVTLSTGIACIVPRGR